MSWHIWVLGLAIAILSAIDAIAWGRAIGEVGDPHFSVGFLFKLITNKWYLLAMSLGFVISMLGYAVMREMGVLMGRFFISLSIVAIVLACTLVLKEPISLRELVGMLLIIAGVLIIGKM
ncbi:MAG: hypothetical protein N3H31_02455 [Candidatus Nezhaarchaeota archaeon]|nr:hypothetical protein [Candidatus Nezhaarchaeota archaeon]